MIAVKGFGSKVDGSPQRDGVTCSNAVGIVRLKPMPLVVARLQRSLVGFTYIFIFVYRCRASLFVVVCCYKAALVENGLCLEEIVESFFHLDGAEYVGRVIALDEGWSQEGMVAVPVGQEDVLRPQPVDDHSGIEEQVELRDDKRRVPSRSRSACENILLVFTWESPFEDF